MLISEAYAQTADAGAAGGAGLLMQFAPLILIFVVFYFLLIRPQQKRAKEHRDMLGALRRGDRVVTGGGIIGLVTKVIGDNELQVEVADGVRVRIIKQTITDILTRGESVRGAKESDEDDKPMLPTKAAGEPAEIGPGPGNPLGTRALYLDAPGIRIHGTPEDSSIGSWANTAFSATRPPDGASLRSPPKRSGASNSLRS